MSHDWRKFEAFKLGYASLEERTQSGPVFAMSGTAPGQPRSQRPETMCVRDEEVESGRWHRPPRSDDDADV